MTIFGYVPANDATALLEVLQIYLESFPLNERHPADVIRERVTHGRYRLIVGRSQNEIVFFALLWPLRGSEFVLLDYMATERNRRGRGIGAEFLRNLRQLPGMSQKILLLEVERPDSGENREQRARRVDFYRRAGAKELHGVRYIMPGLSGGDPTEMILMILPTAEERTMDSATVRKIIVQIYDEVYGRSAQDVLLKSFIDEIPETIALR